MRTVRPHRGKPVGVAEGGIQRCDLIQRRLLLGDVGEGAVLSGAQVQERPRRHAGGHVVHVQRREAFLRVGGKARVVVRLDQVGGVPFRQSAPRRHAADRDDGRDARLERRADDRHLTSLGPSHGRDAVAVHLPAGFQEVHRSAHVPRRQSYPGRCREAPVQVRRIVRPPAGAGSFPGSRMIRAQHHVPSSDEIGAVCFGVSRVLGTRQAGRRVPAPVGRHEAAGKADDGRDRVRQPLGNEQPRPHDVIGFVAVAHLVPDVAAAVATIAVHRRQWRRCRERGPAEESAQMPQDGVALVHERLGRRGSLERDRSNAHGRWLRQGVRCGTQRLSGYYGAR